MANLPITSSNVQSPRGAPGGAPLLRSGLSTVLANTTSTAQTNGMSDAQSAESFGALLAQQMDETRIPILIAPSPAADINASADSANQTGKGNQDKAAAADIPGDPASALAAMLKLPQELKTPVISGEADGAAAHTPAAGKAASQQPTARRDTVQVRATFDMGIDGNQVVRNTSGLEITHPAALADNQTGTSPPTQNAAPLITSLSATILNMSANNSLPVTLPPNTRQTIASPLGSSGWADEFSQKINWISTQQNQIAELHLSPPDLGPLDVVLKISDNQATALFTSPHSAVREAVENALPKLREILADNGITLGNTTVSDQPPRGRDAERFMDQGSGTGTQRGGSGEAPGTEDSLTATAQIAPARRHNGMVDTFA